MANWKDLPFMLLASIFQLLKFDDRFRAGQVCSTWREVCSFPGLWRDVSLYIVRDLNDNAAILKILLTKYGHHINRLTIVGDSTKHSPCPHRPPNDFWICLWKIGLQVSDLCLHNWKLDCIQPRYSERWHLDFVAFLRNQKKVETLVLRNIHLNHLEWMTLLDAIRGLKAYKSKLKSLTIVGGLPVYPAITSRPSYLISLARLGSLEHVTLDYKLCSDAVLFVLAEGTQGRLMSFTIAFSQTIAATISDRAWSAILAASPELQVFFDFRNCSLDANLMDVMNWRIPLHGLKLSCSCAQYITGGVPVSIQQYLLLVISNYSQTLEHLELRLRDNAENLDGIILSVLESCARLKKFFFSGVIRDFTTVWKICNYLSNSPNRFHSFYARPKFLNSFNFVGMKKNYEENRKVLRDKHIHLTVEDPTMGV